MADRTGRAARAGLRLIDGGTGSPELSGALVSFCGHCGAAPARVRHTELERVCEFCGLGVILETDPAAVPDGEPFLVVDAGLAIVAVSDRAEELLGAYEQDVRGRSVSRYLLAGSEPRDGELNYAMAISEALGGGEIRAARARLRMRPSVSARLRIALCGPPRAALVVIAAAEAAKFDPAGRSGSHRR